MMKSIVILLLGCVCLVAALNKDSHKAQLFRSFVKKHNRSYKHSPEEYATRQQIFFDKLDYIENFNKQSDSFKVGINQFADLTDEEYSRELFNMDYITNNVNEDITFDAPASLDWRTSTKPVVVGPVRDNGQCASPAASSIIDSISGDYSVHFSEDFYAFNVSYVSSCDGSKCSGTTTDAVWSFIKKFGLQWYFDNECPTGPGVGICITGPTCVQAGNETALLNAVASKGPISISIDASQTSFQLYKSGVYADTKCSSTKLNYALLLVGYGTENGQDYWIARNSWGSLWGMKGDILIARNKNNLCGVATNACYATTAQNCMCVL